MITCESDGELISYGNGCVKICSPTWKKCLRFQYFSNFFQLFSQSANILGQEDLTTTEEEEGKSLPYNYQVFPIEHFTAGPGTKPTTKFAIVSPFHLL